MEHREEVRQEEQPFPLICVSSIPEERVEEDMTLHSYTHLGLWHRENETVEQTYDRLSYRWKDLGTHCLLNLYNLSWKETNITKISLTFTRQAATVKSIIISKNLDKISDNYITEKYTAEEESPSMNFTEGSVLPLTRCDSFSSLKCFCLRLTKWMFPHGIQQVQLVTRGGAEVSVVQPGNFFSLQRKLNTIISMDGVSLRARVDQQLHVKCDSSSCSDTDNWGMDFSRLLSIHQQLMDMFGCTVPWMLHFARKLVHPFTNHLPQVNEPVSVCM